MYLYVCILYKACYFGKLQQKSANMLPSFAGNPWQISGKVLIDLKKELK